MSQTTTSFPTSSGTGWTNHFNCLTLNSVYATDTGAPDTDLLTVFGATMPTPSGSGINGIEVQIAFQGNFTVAYCKVRKNGVPTGSPTVGQAPNGGYVTIGDPWYKWGTSWSGGESVGVECYFQDDSSGNTCSVDHIQIIVYYDNSPTYNETGSGGIVGGGTCAVKKIVSLSALGGIVGAGSALVTGPLPAAAEATCTVVASSLSTVERVASAIANCSATSSVSSVATIITAASGDVVCTATATTEVPVEVELTCTISASVDSIKGKLASTTAACTASLAIDPVMTWQPQIEATCLVTPAIQVQKGKLVSVEITCTGSLEIDPQLTWRPRINPTCTATVALDPQLTWQPQLAATCTTSASVQIAKEIIGAIAGSCSASVVIDAHKIARTTAQATSSATSAAAAKTVNRPSVLGSLLAGGSARAGVLTDTAATATIAASLAVNPRVRFRPRVTATVAATSIGGANVVNRPRVLGSLLAGGLASVGKITNGAIAASLSGSAATTARRIRAAEAAATVTISTQTTARKTLYGAAAATLQGSGAMNGQRIKYGSAMANLSATSTASTIAEFAAISEASLIATAQCQPVATFVTGSAATCTATTQATYWQHIVEGLAVYLSDKTELTELIGNRLFVNRFPQYAEAPAIAYTIVTNFHNHNLAGASGIATARIQFDIITEHPEDRVEVANALHYVLQGETGLYGAVEVLSVSLESHIDDEVMTDDRDELYLKSMDFNFTYRESIPALNNIVGETSSEIAESIVSGLGDIAKVWPDKVPQHHRGPAIVYRKVSDAELPTSLEEKDANVDAPEYELTIIADRYKTVAELSEKVRLRLHGLSGTLGSTGIWSCVFQDEGSTYSQAIEGSDKAKWWNTMLFSIFTEN